MLAGRDAERATIAALLDAARAGRGGSLVLRGVAGSGKSTLLDDAGTHASDMQVLRTSGVESESPLAFAALQRLLWPVRRRLDHLPAPQQAGLRVALGEAAGDGDRFRTFLGTLSLLAEASEDAPVLAVVDDAHWLDEASSAALLFVARRLQAERVALLFAARSGTGYGFDSLDLPDLVLEGVSGKDAEALLATAGAGPDIGVDVGAGVAVDPSVRDRLVAATGGNPLALRELARRLTRDQLAGREPLPAHLPVAGNVERAFLDRVRRMTEPAQRLLLVAAADDTGRLTVLRDAAGRLGLDDAAVDEAERAGLLRADGDAVTLHHPLVRSAVYRAATSAQRRDAHRALADAVVGDPDRRAWHLAAAIDRPDRDVSASLVDVAERAGSSGGHAAAAAAWARAAELSPEPEQRTHRLAAAAQATWLAGQPGRARSLAEAARTLTTDPLVRADLDRLHARIEWNVGSPLVGHRRLLRAAREIGPVDVERARTMTLLAASVGNFADDGSGHAVGDMTAAVAAVGLPAPTDARGRCSADLLSGFVSAHAGRWTDAAASFRAAFESCDVDADNDVGANLGVAAIVLGDAETILTLHTRLLAAARESGALPRIVHALTRRSFGEIAVGDWRSAAAGAAEALDLARGSGQPGMATLPHAWLALLAALTDQRDHVTDHLAAVDRVPGEGVTAPIIEDLTRWTRGLIAEGPAESLHHLEQLRLGTIARMAAIDRLEAAVRAGRSDVATAWAQDLERFGEAVADDAALASAAYGRALLADADDAEAGFEAAVKHADSTPHRFDRARIHLAYGEHLRRSRRRVQAREHLRAALEVFDDLDASRWTARATQELRASGETARRRDVSSTTELTAQERQVAALVRQGLSNRDVAARLFVSPRTVDFHLRNVFSKLGVASRAELAALPPD